MRLAGLVVVVVVVACAHPTAAPEPNECAPLSFCSETCGNGVIDECAVTNGFGCEQRQEACDDRQGTNCADYGYYGGTGVCADDCMFFDGDSCEACAVSCVDLPTRLPPILATSKTNLAIAYMNDGGYRLTLLDASLNEVATAKVPYLPVGMVAVPDGWLLVELNDPYLLLQHVDVAGTVTSPPQPISPTSQPPACEYFAGIAYGPGGRALVLCNNWPTKPLEPGPGVVAVIVDTSGAVLVQPFYVYAPQFEAVGTVTTDGTSFFVAAGGQLAVVASDGTISSRILGYPTEPQSLAQMGVPSGVSWSGSSGWYVVPSDATDFTAQAFDATGSMVGSPVSIHTMSSTTGLQAFNTGLIGTSTAPPTPFQPESRFAIARIDATGALVASTEVGVVAAPVNQVVVPFGSGVAVAWSTANTGHVALVTP